MPKKKQNEIEFYDCLNCEQLNECLPFGNNEINECKNKKTIKI